MNSNENRRELSEGFRRSVDPVLPAVVTVEVQRGPRNLPPEPQESKSAHPEQPHDPSEQTTDFARDGSGSGIIIDRRGYVLTCNHVVEFAENVFVRLSDGRRFESKNILTDPVIDLAIIQIVSQDNLPEAPLGNSDELNIGDWVASIGNPYELGLSISAGIISATDRHLPTSPRTHLLQTDAASNPGNSGGALVNLQGQVVGISEGGYGSHEGFQGIGFAIPINAAMRTAHRLINEGEVTHIRLDFDTEPLETKVANFLGLKPDDGLIICSIVTDSPAARAGIRVGDVVTNISETPIHKSCDVVTAIEKAVPGKPLLVTLYRAGTNYSVELTPEALETSVDEKATALLAHDESTANDIQYGLTVDVKSADEIKELGFDRHSEAVIVTNVSPHSMAAKEGICAGMIVLRVGSETVETLSDYQRAMKAASSKPGVLILFGTPEQQHFVLIEK
jgi:serine protease Do